MIWQGHAMLLRCGLSFSPIPLHTHDWSSPSTSLSHYIRKLTFEAPALLELTDSPECDRYVTDFLQKYDKLLQNVTDSQSVIRFSRV